MKHIAIFTTGTLLMLFTSVASVAQEDGKKLNLTASADFYSSFLFRGTKYGHGPSVQPTVRMTAGNFTAGVWGAFDFRDYSETDTYLSYSFPFGLSLGLTDYYFPDLDLFETSAEYGSHALEINAGFTKGGFSLSANCVLNEAGGVGTMGGDVYFQAGYNFGPVNILAGAGNGWNTEEYGFSFCNFGIGTTRTIRVTDTFSIPVTGQVVLNPDRKQLFVAVGFTL